MSQTPAGQMFVKVSENIHDPQRMNPKDVCDLSDFLSGATSWSNLGFLNILPAISEKPSLLNETLFF